MLSIRKAKTGDKSSIVEILKGWEFYDPAKLFEGYWVVERGNKIIGVLHLTEYDDFLYLSNVGVVEEARREGVAARLLSDVLGAQDKDVYLYTVIPRFFEKFGFVAVDKPDKLPPENQVLCEGCPKERCMCMLRTHSNLPTSALKNDRNHS